MGWRCPWDHPDGAVGQLLALAVRDAQGDERLLKGQEGVAQSCTGAVGRAWGPFWGLGYREDMGSPFGH